ncbi:GtrA family protein [Neobacillus niacini]|uniref:GtrA family protein n=1 Tax=Neobacillus niacini TaxID=86668 RepID=UPI0030009680
MENDYKSNTKSVNFILENKFIKYCMTGVFNTVHHYVWFLLLSPVIGYSFSNLVSFIIANIASFFINSYFTFQVTPSLRSFIKYPKVIIVQAVIAYLVPALCLAFFPNSKLFVPVLTTIINLPIGYLLTKKVIQN